MQNILLNNQIEQTLCKLKIFKSKIKDNLKSKNNNFREEFLMTFKKFKVINVSCVSGRLNLVVVGELSQRQPLSPVILVMVDEDAQVLLNFLIDALCLAIGLGVVCRRWVPFNVQ